MSVTITVSSRAYGNNKQYIAHISGRAAKFTFEREFVGRKTGRHNDTTEFSTDEPGLYEHCDIDKKGNKNPDYLVVARAPSGELVEMRSSLEDAMKIARRLDDGEKLQDMLEFFETSPGSDCWGYELRSKTETKTATAGQTINSATEACWTIIQALPTREATKVLAALKLRVSPAMPLLIAAADDAEVMP